MTMSILYYYPTKDKFDVALFPVIGYSYDKNYFSRHKHGLTLMWLCFGIEIAW